MSAREPHLEVHALPPNSRDPMRVSSSSAGAKLLALSLLSVAGIVVSATAATVYAAGEPQRRLGQRNVGAAKSTSSASIGARAAQLRLLVDSLIAPLGPFEPVDSVTLGQLISLVTRPADSAAFLRQSATNSSQAPRDPLLVYRAWARSAELPPLWAYRPGFANVHDSRVVPIVAMQSFKRLWRANEADADSALVRGDVQTALLRARENIAASRHLMHQPFMINVLIGRVLLSDGAKLLARVALQADEPTLHSAALRLQNDASATHAAAASLLHGLVRMGADPNDTRLISMAADQSQYPFARTLAVERMVTDMCYSTRDVLLGPSQARYDAVDRMFTSMRDIPRVNELAPLYRRTLDGYRDTPGTDLPAPRVDEPMSRTMLRFVVPTKVYQRVEYCRHLLNQSARQTA